MERLVIYDTDQFDCSGLYALGNDPDAIVIGERPHPLSPETADETATMAAVFVTSRVDRRVLVRMPHLRLLVCLSTGTNHVDLRECAARGITVCNLPDYGAGTVAEYTLGLMLALARRVPETTTLLKAGRATRSALVGRDLAGQTLTVVGTGRIGANVIRLARALGMHVLGVDVAPRPELAAELGFEYVGLHDGLAAADIVSLHTPLTPDNRHLLNRRSLALLKPDALIINTARGELIDTTALLHALHTGKLGGAALDVVEHEELLGGSLEMQVEASGHVTTEVKHDLAEHEALLTLPNVILTGHNAYNTHQAHARMTAGGVEVVRAYQAGQPMNVVRPAAH
jgi:D-lactate dehydrogenase